MVAAAAVQNLLMSWWYDDDQGHFDEFPDYFTAPTSSDWPATRRPT